MKGTSVHVKNMRVKQLFKVRDSAMALRARKVPEAFEKRAPGARFSKLPVITGPVKLFCFPFQTGASEGLKIVQ